MKILCWNVNGIRSCFSKGLASFIAEEDPDLICLQETKAYEEQCEEISKAFKQYQAFWHSAEKPGYSGVLTLSKKLPKDHQIGMGLKNIDREGRVILTEHSGFYLVNLYFPNGAQSEERHFFKMKFLDEILKYFKSLDRHKPLVMTGDFNIAHKEIDIHDPIRLDGESGFKPEERAWMDQLVASGFHDSFRLKNPLALDQYSWWSYRQLSRQRNKGWRIDYFFVSDRLKSQLKSIEMRQDIMGSDHCPLILEIGT